MSVSGESSAVGRSAAAAAMSSGDSRAPRVGLYCSIEEELWRIFTFYALHADATQPESFKPANFLRFCKDVQIISPRLSSSAVELEITRHVRANKPVGEDYNPSTALTFTDFMQLLEHLAVKVYVRDDAEVACKRLMLENVLLLANRRIPSNDLYDLHNAEAQRLLQPEVFGRSLQHIFRYYLDKAEHRRNTAISAEKSKHREFRRVNALDLDEPLPQQMQQQLLALKLLAKQQRDTISYKEYLNFCQDFNLKSTSLLTAIQVGEVFLNIVPLHATSASALPAGSAAAAAAAAAVAADANVSPQLARNSNSSSSGSNGGGMVVRKETGMSFELFCQAVVYLALIAYRHLGSNNNNGSNSNSNGSSDIKGTVPTHYKVKALFLYMYKTINDSRRTLRLLSGDRSNALSGAVHGSLNIFGCGLFCCSFQSQWQRDGFRDYTKTDAAAALSGTTMLRKVVGESIDGEDGPQSATAAAPEDDDAVSALGTPLTPRSTASRSMLQRPATATAVMGSGQSIAERLRQQLTLSPEPTAAVDGEEGDDDGCYCYNNSSSDGAGGVIETPFRSDRPVDVAAEDLRVLFSRRPELTEFLFLEIQNMRTQTARLTGKAALQQQLHQEHT